MDDAGSSLGVPPYVAVNSTTANPSRGDKTLIMRTAAGWYPIEASGTKPLKDEARDHGLLNGHVTSIEDIDGNVLWRKQ
jgi:hypothetical protein